MCSKHVEYREGKFGSWPLVKQFVLFLCSWATVQDELAMESPAFFCDNCFDLLHYTSDKKKVVDFQAYPYYDEMTALLDSNAPPITLS